MHTHHSYLNKSESSMAKEEFLNLKDNIFVNTSHWKFASRNIMLIVFLLGNMLMGL